MAKVNIKLQLQIEGIIEISAINIEIETNNNIDLKTITKHIGEMITENIGDYILKDNNYDDQSW